MVTAMHLAIKQLTVLMASLPLTYHTRLRILDAVCNAAMRHLTGCLLLEAEPHAQHRATAHRSLNERVLR